jgi:Putative Actinobacterial Holin-X, holin superfamily III
MPLSRNELPTSARSLPDLVHQLLTQLTLLMRQELALARIELHKSSLRLASSMGVILWGWALLYAGFLLLLVAAVCGLALVMPLWLAAASLGSLIGAGGLWLLLRGRVLLKNAQLAPSHLSSSLRRDKDALLHRTLQ